MVTLLEDVHGPSTYEVSVGTGMLGLELEVDNSASPELVVSYVMKGGALEGRVRVGDILLRIQEQDVRNLSLAAVQRLCRQLRRKRKTVTFMHSYY
jgi:hypothetical protein